MHMHVVAEDFSIPANWGPFIEGTRTRYSALNWYFQTLPSGDTTWVIWQRHRLEFAWETVGHWNFTNTSPYFTATTVDDRQLEFLEEDVFLVETEASIEPDLARATFTVWGK